MQGGPSSVREAAIDAVVNPVGAKPSDAGKRKMGGSRSAGTSKAVAKKPQKQVLDDSDEDSDVESVVCTLAMWAVTVQALLLYQSLDCCPIYMRDTLYAAV